MDERWRTAVFGGVIGAAVSLAVVLGAVVTGVIPVATDSRIHGYLMAHPSVVYDMQAKAEADETAARQLEQQQAIDRMGLKKFFDPAVAYVTGPADAKNTFVEFFDYNCGHCRNTAGNVKKFYEKHKNDTRFAFIDYPIITDASTSAARVAVAARRQGDRYLALHFALMSEGTAGTSPNVLSSDAAKAGLDMDKLTKDMSDPVIEKTIIAALRLAREAHFSGTPVFVVNGKVHEGEISEAEIKKLLEEG
jgi:protein-disulfide isomerase